MQHGTYVLVHGAYHGGWCWKDVASLLRARGHTVYTPTLTGLGERSHLMSCKPDLYTFIEDVAQVLRYEELNGVCLVGHSFAGSVISGVADKMPERLSHLVYLDALVLRSGESSATRSPERAEAYRQKAIDYSDGLYVPPNAPEHYGITDPKVGAWLASKMTPHPLKAYYDKLNLSHPLANGVPASYIACSDPLFAATEKSRELARSLGWKYLEIATAHNAMTLKPRELSEMLMDIAAS